MRGLYLHIPFCVKKCAYCDFYSLPSRTESIQAYIQALMIEARQYQGTDFRTLYLGGGTPSLLGASALGKLLDGLRNILDLSGLVEATLEANPDSASPDLLAVARAGGINRISIGIQAFSDAELKKAGRVHDSVQGVEAIRKAGAAGFTNISADLIIGLPGQDWDSLRTALDTLTRMDVQHISAYCLQLEPHTPMGDNPPPELPTEDLQAEFYDRTRDFLSERGFIHYEISNFARRGFECRHNLNYWTGGEYLGLGPGAASHLEGRRFKNRPDLDAYLATPTSLLEDMEQLKAEEKSAEEAILRLRLLTEGLDIRELAGKFGLEHTQALENRLNMLAEKELLIRQGSRYRLPKNCVLTCNPILARVLGE